MTLWKTIVSLVMLGVSLAGCTGRSIVRIYPSEAEVSVDGKVLRGNSFEYGRWISNSYVIKAWAPGYRSTELVAEVDLGARAGSIALLSLAMPIIAIPALISLPWNGELEDVITIYLEEGEAPG